MYGSFPKVTIRGKYTADGRILILPIRGDGNADITLENSKFSVKFKPSLHPKNGKTYLMVDKLKVLIEPQKYVKSFSPQILKRPNNMFPSFFTE